MPDAHLQERLLVWLLRLAGGVTITAFLAVFLPVDWMAATHRWLGMGEFPRAPVVDYLARSIAAMYGIHGGLLLLISGDPRRYRRVIAYIGVMNVLFGVALIAIDVHAGMPWFWTFAEGPPLIVVGVLVLSLNHRLPYDRTGAGV